MTARDGTPWYLSAANIESDCSADNGAGAVEERDFLEAFAFGAGAFWVCACGVFVPVAPHKTSAAPSKNISDRKKTERFIMTGIFCFQQR